MDTLNINGLTSYASSIASSQATSEMTGKAKAAQTDEELMSACKEFETYLWEQVIKSMKSTVNIVGEDSTNSQLVNYFMDSAITDVAGNLTEKTSGPGSLAQQMYEQMKRNNTIDVQALLEQGGVSTVVADGDN